MEVVYRGKNYYIDYVVDNLYEELYFIALVNLADEDDTIDVMDLPQALRYRIEAMVSRDAWTERISLGE